MIARVRGYVEDDAKQWDELVNRSWNGTFLHTRRYLAHHGNRFVDRSAVIVDDRDRIRAVFAAADDPIDPSRAVSHPGLSYGGLVHDGSARGEVAIDIIAGLAAFLRAAGKTRAVYKAVPAFYHQVPTADDRYALFRLGAERYRCDIAAVIDVSAPAPASTLRRRQLIKARRNGIMVSRDPALLEPYWGVLAASLLNRHGVMPVHSAQEMAELMRQFPDNICLLTAVADGAVCGGVILYVTPRAVHVQYQAGTDSGRKSGALDLVIDAALALTRESGARYLDFGISNEQDGRVLNSSLYNYKLSFGAGSWLHEFYTLALGGRRPRS